MSDIADSIVMLTGDEYRKMMAGIAASNHFAVKYLAHIDEQNVEVARLTAENKKLRAALLVARKYVLVQSCELSLQPDDAARDLDVIDEALEEDDD